uniref:Uncharacterized protein n=1 Tax=viral metagenome TaxID=1070528 RepID=A0A6C0BEH2_9ZZZZ
MTDNINTCTDLKTVGERKENIVNEMASLYEATGVEYFKSQASAWSQWIWILQDRKLQEWQITYSGNPQGEWHLPKILPSIR